MNPALRDKPPYILLIDDDEDEKDIFELAAARAYLSITLDHVATCDKERLAALSKPDFIFLDINMPVCDGFGWLQSIREKVADPIPVIMYSTTRNPENVQKAYQLGANLFVTKPTTPGKLSLILQNVLQMDWSNPKKLTEAQYGSGQFHLAD